MRVFVSYPFEKRELALQLHGRLCADGHRVRCAAAPPPDGIEGGATFDDWTRESIQWSNFIVFLCCPGGVDGRYMGTEVTIAAAEGRLRPGRVLAVLLNRMLPEQVPAQLGAMSLLVPSGDVVADVAVVLDRIRRVRRALRVAALSAIVALVAIAASLRAVIRPPAPDVVGSDVQVAVSGCYARAFPIDLEPLALSVDGRRVWSSGARGEGLVAVDVSGSQARTPRLFGALPVWGGVAIAYRDRVWVGEAPSRADAPFAAPARMTFPRNHPGDLPQGQVPRLHLVDPVRATLVSGDAGIAAPSGRAWCLPIPLGDGRSCAAFAVRKPGTGVIGTDVEVYGLDGERGGVVDPNPWVRAEGGLRSYCRLGRGGVLALVANRVDSSRRGGDLYLVSSVGARRVLEDVPLHAVYDLGVDDRVALVYTRQRDDGTWVGRLDVSDLLAGQAGALQLGEQRTIIDDSESVIRVFASGDQRRAWVTATRTGSPVGPNTTNFQLLDLQTYSIETSPEWTSSADVNWVRPVGLDNLGVVCAGPFGASTSSRGLEVLQAQPLRLLREAGGSWQQVTVRDALYCGRGQRAWLAASRQLEGSPFATELMRLVDLKSASPEVTDLQLSAAFAGTAGAGGEVVFGAFGVSDPTRAPRVTTVGLADASPTHPALRIVGTPCEAGVGKRAVSRIRPGDEPIDVELDFSASRVAWGLNGDRARVHVELFSADREIAGQSVDIAGTPGIVRVRLSGVAGQGVTEFVRASLRAELTDDNQTRAVWTWRGLPLAPERTWLESRPWLPWGVLAVSLSALLASLIRLRVLRRSA